MNNRFLVPLLLLLTILLSGCDKPYESKSQEDREDDISTLKPVQADSILDIATWNLEWYGDDTYGDEKGYGPKDEKLQTKHILQVMDSLDADLYGLEEVFSQQALDDLVDHMSGYRGFVAPHISWKQKTAFIYNTNVIDSVQAGGITEGQNDDAWANGRFPLYFKFTYTYQNTSHQFYAIDIHAKAFGDRASYERRKKAARELYNFLNTHKPHARIILMGDYNDDVDRSIYQGMKSPYAPFVRDTSHYNITTMALSTSGQRTTVENPGMIDHIIISDELFQSYIQHSAVIVNPAKNNFINNYGETTSDHYPVWAKFRIK